MTNWFITLANLSFFFAMGKHWVDSPDWNYSLMEAIFFAIMAIYYKKDS